jgi:eukaryotic-like serine/threonine-protein kinase
VSEARTPLLVLGRYELFDEIATGGMASVHVGRSVGAGGLGRTVAIKRALPAFARDRDFVERFLDEAHLAMRVSHPNVVPTLDVVAADGELFIVMDYVHGESMESILRRERDEGTRMPLPIAIHVIAGILYGLHAAHEAHDERGNPLGLVHRDVSPQNIILGADGVPRLFDFGVAKAIGTLHTTREGRLEGKLAYMAPEQLERRGVDRRADVYAASVVLWEALTGKKLHDGADEVDVFVQVARGHVDAPHELVPEVPEALSRIVMQGLARAPEARFPTAKEMARQLESLRLQGTTLEAAEWAVARAGQKLVRRQRVIDRIDRLAAPDSKVMRAAVDTSLAAANEGSRRSNRPASEETSTHRDRRAPGSEAASSNAPAPPDSSASRAVRSRSGSGDSSEHDSSVQAPTEPPRGTLDSSGGAVEPHDLPPDMSPGSMPGPPRVPSDIVDLVANNDEENAGGPVMELRTRRAVRQELAEEAERQRSMRTWALLLAAALVLLLVYWLATR